MSCLRQGPALQGAGVPEGCLPSHPGVSHQVRPRPPVMPTTYDRLINDGLQSTLAVCLGHPVRPRSHKCLSSSVLFSLFILHWGDVMLCCTVAPLCDTECHVSVEKFKNVQLLMDHPMLFSMALCNPPNLHAHG